jgi:hypothetical protein
MTLRADKRHNLGILGRPNDSDTHLAASSGDDFVLLHTHDHTDDFNMSIDYF